MKRFLFLSSLFFVMLAFCGCSELTGDPTTKTFSIHGFYSKLKVEGNFHVTVSDAASKVIVVAGENVMPKVVVEVVDETLKIYLKDFSFSSLAGDMDVLVPRSANLSSIVLSDAAQFQSGFEIETRKVDVTLTGDSKCYLEVDAKELTVDLTGASEAVLKGKAVSINAHLSGASRMSERKNEKKYALSCELFEGALSGASSAFIHCDGTINVDLSGASRLHYTGDASTKGSTVTGNSQILHDKL